MFPMCPQKARETGRVIIWPLSAMNTLRTLVTSDPAFMGLTSFLNVRSIFLTMCQTSHTSRPPIELGPFSSKSVSPSVVHNSRNCSSFTSAPKLEIPGLTMTFLPQFLSSVCNAFQAHLKLCLSKLSPLFPAPCQSLPNLSQRLPPLLKLAYNLYCLSQLLGNLVSLNHSSV